MAYVLWLERIDPEDRDEFDTWLKHEPEVQQVKELTPEQADLYEAFGLRRSA